MSESSTLISTQSEGPAAIRPDEDFQRFLKQGHFMLQRSRSSGRYVFYPRVLEPGTANSDLEWVPASGLGVVYSATVVRVKPPAPCYNVALVDLAEGPRLMTRIEGIDPEHVRIGMRVRARIACDDGAAYVVFDPAETQENS